MARGATNVVGLDIGADAIKAVQLRKTGEGLRVVGRPGYVPTPSGSVSGGVVVDEGAVAGAISQMISDCGFTTKTVVASVGGTTSVTVRVVTMPRMSGAELSDAMDYELAMNQSGGLISARAFLNASLYSGIDEKSKHRSPSLN